MNFSNLFLEASLMYAHEDWEMDSLVPTITKLPRSFITLLDSAIRYMEGVISEGHVRLFLCISLRCSFFWIK